MSETVIDITARLRRPAARNAEPSCFCATSLEQVQSAWRLVYDRYTRMELIYENAFGIHAAPSGVGQHACVIWRPQGPRVGSTMTLMGDNPCGLALDAVYPLQLNELRQKQRRLMEVGMLADHDSGAGCGIKALFDMMGWAIHYGLQTDVTDVVIGVHPRHAQFYIRCYGFEAIGPTTSYPQVRNHPVVPLRLRLAEGLAQDVLPRGLAYARAHPLPRGAFANRFTFEPRQLRGSLIAGYLKAQHNLDPCGTTEPTREPATISFGQPGRLWRTSAAFPA